MGSTERFAAVTMVYQDYWFLKLWLDYYSKHFGRENLYVLGHGFDPEHERLCEGANLIRVPRNGMFPDFDSQRWRMLSDFSTTMQKGYTAVVCTDVDEIVVAHRDPDNLARVLAEADLPDRAGAIGFEVIGADEFDTTKPLLQQTKGCVFSSRYSKPCVLRQAGQFTPGAHGMVNDWAHTDALVLFHLQYANAAQHGTRKSALREELQEAAREADSTRPDHKVSGLRDWARGKQTAYQRTLGILTDGEHMPFDQAIDRCRTILQKTMFRDDEGTVRVRPRKARFFRTGTQVPDRLAQVF